VPLTTFGSPHSRFRFAHGFATASRPSMRLTQTLSTCMQPVINPFTKQQMEYLLQLWQEGLHLSPPLQQVLDCTLPLNQLHTIQSYTIPLQAIWHFTNYTIEDKKSNLFPESFLNFLQRQQIPSLIYTPNLHRLSFVGTDWQKAYVGFVVGLGGG
jgi:hypothetical protein